MKKTEQNLRDLWDMMKYTNILILWALEGKERDKKGGRMNIWRNITEKFPNLVKSIADKRGSMKLK